MIDYALAIILGYLLGSIPFGFLATNLAGLGDVRAIGSGNIGATNVLRTGRRDLAALTLVLDAGKGAVAVLAANWFWGYDVALLAGVAAFLGHIFPVWLGFKGGKGVATYVGILLALNWVVGLIFCVTWLLILFTQRYSSLAALTAAATAPMFAFAFSGVQLTWVTGVLSIVLYITHRENIMRLIAGTESKVGGKNAGQD
jgi:glycerol-3-phosphate acyltransferase PlsY